MTRRFFSWACGLSQRERNRNDFAVLTPSIKTFQMIRFLVAGLACVGTGGIRVCGASAPESGHRYSAIVAQNIFRLRPEVRLEVLPTKPSLPPPVRPGFRVTGFTDVCGRNQVLLEISEQGKSVVRRVLAVGEHFMGLEVEAIDVVAAQARLRIHGDCIEVTLSSSGVRPPESPGLKLPRK